MRCLKLRYVAGGWARLALALAIMPLIALMPACAADKSSAPETSAYGLLDHLETQFNPNYQTVKPARFTPGLSREEAIKIAVDCFMDGFDIPRGRGAEQVIKADATTAIYSGARGGFGGWEIFDRPVWVVVLYDLPIHVGWSGAPGPSQSDDDFVRYYKILDASTGEDLSGATQGSGSPGPDWDGIDLSKPGLAEAPPAASHRSLL